jgi:glycosyltransferase involved in cell wall biosynthesis
MPAAIVIPTYREAENVVRVVTAVRAALPGAVVLVVDDASGDGTADLAEGAGAEVLRREGARGLGPAYREGFARALDRGWDPIFQMDADLSHDPADLPRLDAVDADLVLGSRWARGGGTRNWGLGRRLLSRFGSAYARAWLGLPFRDLTGGFKRWRADLLRRVDPASLVSDGYAFQVEATWRASEAGARIVEVPIVFTERTAGASKMSATIALEAALRVPRLR